MTTSELSSTDLKHFTLTYDKSDQALLGYVNGILEVEDSGVSFSTNNGTDDLAMADTDNAGNIVLDDIRIYDDVRTPAQVAWDYNRGGPVAWYRFDECQGSVAHDASGNNSHGTITSGGAYGNTSVGSCNSGDSTEMWDDGTNGKFNSALGLDGDDDYASSSSQLFYNEQPQFSFFAWIKRSAINNWDRVGGAYEWNSGNYGSWYLNTGQNNGAPACGALIDGSWEATTTDNNSLGQTGRWYHVGCVYDGSNLISYLDGVPQDSVSASGNLASTAYPFLIGTTNGISGTQNNFQGLIDDARIYNYGLTPAQVRTLYNGGSAIRFAPLTGSP